MNRLCPFFCAVLTLLAPWAATGQSQSSNSRAALRDPAQQFLPAYSYALNANPWAVCSADFNGDGNTDLAVAGIAINGTDIAVTIALGQGNGQFTLEKDFTIASGGYRPSGIAAADLNHDGKVDIVVTYLGPTSGAVSIFLGNGDGTFSPGATYSVGGGGVLLADLNHDGIPDIAASQQSGTGVDILLGNGDGTFISGVSLTALTDGAWGDLSLPI